MWLHGRTSAWHTKPLWQPLSSRQVGEVFCSRVGRRRRGPQPLLQVQQQVQSTTPDFIKRFQTLVVCCSSYCMLTVHAAHLAYCASGLHGLAIPGESMEFMQHINLLSLITPLHQSKLLISLLSNGSTERDSKPLTDPCHRYYTRLTLPPPPPLLPIAGSWLAPCWLQPNRPTASYASTPQ
jgi:hypothetical protein